MAGVIWSGLDRFLDELRGLDVAVSTDAHAILTGRADDAKTAIAAAYPVRSGALRAGLVIRPARRPLLAGCTLVQTAPHGHLYEHGTEDRENKAGANRGRMPATPTFVPIATTHQHRGLSAVIDRLLSAHGATRVTGEPT